MGFLDRFKSEKEQELKDASKQVEEKGEEKSDEEQAVNASVSAEDLPSNLADVVLKPHVTEKSARLASEGKYVFIVAKDTNKTQIKMAVRAMYDVNPISVNTQVVRGKVVRFGRHFGKRKNWKKAIVSLPEGESISIFEGV